jgi:hypothetical protein
LSDVLIKRPSRVAHNELTVDSRGRLRRVLASASQATAAKAKPQKNPAARSEAKRRGRNREEADTAMYVP